MIEAMETLLEAWGDEVVSPRLDVSIRSQLGALFDAAPGGAVGGSRCLSSVECAVVMSRAAVAVNSALDLLAMDEPSGLGARGRVLARLAQLRYAVRPRLVVDEQCRLLGVSVRTYRSRVDELHVELAALMPVVVQARAEADLSTPGYVASLARRALAREAERESKKAIKRLRAAAKAHARSLLGVDDAAA